METDQPSIAPIHRKYRTFYPDTGECVDCFAETLTEVYSAAIKHGGRGVIKVMAVGGWTDCLGLEIPEVRK